MLREEGKEAKKRVCVASNLFHKYLRKRLGEFVFFNLGTTRMRYVSSQASAFVSYSGHLFPQPTKQTFVVCIMYGMEKAALLSLSLSGGSLMENGQHGRRYRVPPLFSNSEQRNSAAPFTKPHRKMTRKRFWNGLRQVGQSEPSSDAWNGKEEWRL